jgi:ABC-type transport system substrate-binding protein
VRSIAARNENYWKPNRPYLDEIEFLAITDESARVNALLGGQLGLISAVDPRSVATTKAASGSRCSSPASLASWSSTRACLQHHTTYRARITPRRYGRRS